MIFSLQKFIFQRKFLKYINAYESFLYCSSPFFIRDSLRCTFILQIFNSIRMYKQKLERNFQKLISGKGFEVGIRMSWVELNITI